MRQRHGSFFAGQGCPPRRTSPSTSQNLTALRGLSLEAVPVTERVVVLNVWLQGQVGKVSVPLIDYTLGQRHKSRHT